MNEHEYYRNSINQFPKHFIFNDRYFDSLSDSLDYVRANENLSIKLLPFYSFVSESHIAQSDDANGNKVSILFNCRTASFVRHFISGIVKYQDQSFILTQLKSLFDQRLFNTNKRHHALVAAELKLSSIYAVADHPGVLNYRDSNCLGQQAMLSLPDISLKQAFQIADHSLLGHEIGHYLFRNDREFAKGMRSWITSNMNSCVEDFRAHLIRKIPDPNEKQMTILLQSMMRGGEVIIPHIDLQLETSKQVLLAHECVDRIMAHIEGDYDKLIEELSCDLFSLQHILQNVNGAEDKDVLLFYFLLINIYWCIYFVEHFSENIDKDRMSTHEIPRENLFGFRIFFITNILIGHISIPEAVKRYKFSLTAESISGAVLDKNYADRLSGICNYINHFVLDAFVRQGEGWRRNISAILSDETATAEYKKCASKITADLFFCGNPVQEVSDIVDDYYAVRAKQK